MNNALQIPLVGGQKQDLDEAIMPDGLLSEVLNLRMDRGGAWVKRKRYSGLVITTTQKGPVVSLARLGDQRLVIAGAPPAVLQSQYDSEVRHFDVRWLPWFDAAQRETLVVDLDENVDSVHVARANNWTVTVYEMGGYLKSVLHRDSDGSIARFDTLDSANADDAKVVTCGNNIICVYQDTASGMRAVVMDTSGSGVPTWGTPFTLDATTVGQFDIANLSGTSDLLFTHQRTSTTLVTERRASPYTSVTNTRPDTLTSGNYTPSIEGASGEGVWIAYIDHSTGALVAFSTDDDLTNPTSKPTLHTDADNDNKISIARVAAASRVVVWTGFDATTNFQGYVKFVDIDNAGNAGTTRTRYGVRLVSKAWAQTGKDFGSNEEYVCCVVTNDAETVAVNNGGDENFRTYFVLLFSPNLGTGADSYPFHLTFAQDVACQPADQGKITAVATVTSGGQTTHTFAGLCYVRGVRDAEPVRGVALWRWKSTGYDRCRPVEMGGALYFSGGILSRWDGVNAYEAGWLLAPDIISAISSNGAGALTNSATYSYVAVLETTTKDGVRVQSTPSFVATVVMGATDDTVALTIRDMLVRSQFQPLGITALAHVHIYRTLANEADLRRVTPDGGLPVGSLITTAGTIAYTDLTSDADLADSEIVYTAGGVLPHAPPPPCRFMAKVGERLWSGGGENPYQFRCSKEFTGGEPVQWAAEVNQDDPQFGAIVDEPGTAVADMDGTPVLFTRRTITLMLGQGPDDHGEGAFTKQTLPSDFGATDHRPVATCAKGVLFRSTRGIELLPRGQGEPVWIGAAVADVIDAYPEVTSVVVLEKDQTVRWTAHDGAGNGCVIMWNMTYDVWSYFTNLAGNNAEYVLGAEWDGNHVVATADMADTSPIRLEQDSGVEAAYTVSRIRLGHITLEGISKYYKAKSVVLNLRYRAACDVVIEVEYDGDTAATDSKTFTLSGLTAGKIYPFEFALPRQKVDRLQITVYDTDSLGTQGVEYLGIVLNYKPQRGHRRLASVYRG